MTDILEKPTRPASYSNHLNIGADTVRSTLRDQVAAGTMTEEQSEVIWWVFNFAKSQKMDLKTIATELGYADPTTPYRVFLGKYGASVEPFCEKARKLKVLADERASYIQGFFVETSTAKKVFTICDAARISQTVAFVFGDSQLGKTTALQEYTRRNNHGATLYVRLPASSGIQILAKELARAAHVNPDSCFEKLRDRVLAAIDKNQLVIIDELHQVFTSYQASSQIKVLEFLREIHDRTQCGMVLCGTHVLKREIETGKLAMLLEQFRRRGTLRLELPAKPSKTDISRLAAGFDLDAPGERELAIIRDMVATSGLGMYVKFLQAGHRMAHKAEQAMTWDHFASAYSIISKFSKPSKKDEEDSL
jgi:DNA transposition AAA+ family ATPase